MKRFLSVLLFGISILMLLSSCSNKKVYPLTVGGTELDGEIYSYFLQEIMAENKGVTNSATLKELAADRCAEYIGVNTFFEDSGCSLSSKEKRTVADNTENIWSFYSKYYTDIGISKQTIGKVEEYRAYKEYLLNYYYGTDGISPVAEEEIKKYFYENYIAFKAINGYLTTVNSDGKTVKMTEAEIAAVKAQFDTMAASINGGQSIDEVNQAYVIASETGSSGTVETLILEKSSTSYPATFFETVFSMAYNTAGVQIFDDYIFVIQRLDLLTVTDLFESYRATCLSNLKSEDFEKLINDWAEGYSVISDTELVDTCYDTVSARRNKIAN